MCLPVRYTQVYVCECTSNLTFALSREFQSESKENKTTGFLRSKLTKISMSVEGTAHGSHIFACIGSSLVLRNEACLLYLLQ